MILNLRMKYISNNSLHIVYKTTNLVNGKIYIGVHKTRDIDSDLYCGSGSRFLIALNKYGRENFIRETLYIYHSEKVAYLREKYIVNENYLLSNNHYNLQLGGKGGFHGTYT